MGRKMTAEINIDKITNCKPFNVEDMWGKTVFTKMTKTSRVAAGTFVTIDFTDLPKLAMQELAARTLVIKWQGIQRDRCKTDNELLERLNDKEITIVAKDLIGSSTPEVKDPTIIAAENMLAAGKITRDQYDEFLAEVAALTAD